MSLSTSRVMHGTAHDQQEEKKYMENSCSSWKNNNVETWMDMLRIKFWFSNNNVKTCPF